MTVDSTDIQRLKEAVATKPVGDLQSWAATEEGGIDELLRKIFDAIPTMFLPEKAAREKLSVLQYEITTPDGPRKYFIKVENGTCESGEGSANDPTASLTVDFPDFLRIITGNLAGMQAYLSGKLKITGDTLFVNRFEGWFKRP
ncbi:SCP2 sterol-binding domain-containing protein [Actinomadura sp. KC216]|uniref:SCP2 sterol-binding domain-containing protein n=1 Tax=Actinomadura sp. KC216 TaxID=2530370 RepID=UPI0010499A3B|nr:SCP2 sterol-binding domain-containing protein [Actinomadura sp. KC216]TDB85812.1 SCP2 sterol-binding domain-containing protein [Actinomadura sp. KC216]